MMLVHFDCLKFAELVEVHKLFNLLALFYLRNFIQINNGIVNVQISLNALELLNEIFSTDLWIIIQVMSPARCINH